MIIWSWFRVNWSTFEFGGRYAQKTIFYIFFPSDLDI